MSSAASEASGSRDTVSYDTEPAPIPERLLNVPAQYEIELRIFHGLCLLATVVGGISIGFVLRIPTVSFFFLAVVLVWFSPLRIDLTVANVNQIQFAMAGVLIALVAGQQWAPPSDCESLAGTTHREHRLKSFQQLSDSGCLRRNTVRWFVVGCWLGLCIAFKPSLVWCGVMLGIFSFLQTRDRSSGWISASHTVDLLAPVAGGLPGATAAVGLS